MVRTTTKAQLLSNTSTWNLNRCNRRVKTQWHKQRSQTSRCMWNWERNWLWSSYRLGCKNNYKSKWSASWHPKQENGHSMMTLFPNCSATLKTGRGHWNRCKHVMSSRSFEKKMPENRNINISAKAKDICHQWSPSNTALPARKVLNRVRARSRGDRWAGLSRRS